MHASTVSVILIQLLASLSSGSMFYQNLEWWQYFEIVQCYLCLLWSASYSVLHYNSYWIGHLAQECFHWTLHRSGHKSLADLCIDNTTVLFVSDFSPPLLSLIRRVFAACPSVVLLHSANANTEALLCFVPTVLCCARDKTANQSQPTIQHSHSTAAAF